LTQRSAPIASAICWRIDLSYASVIRASVIGSCRFVGGAAGDPEVGAGGRFDQAVEVGADVDHAEIGQRAAPARLAFCADRDCDLAAD
jgi:hypothetical protein